MISAGLLRADQRSLETFVCLDRKQSTSVPTKKSFTTLTVKHNYKFTMLNHMFDNYLFVWGRGCFLFTCVLSSYRPARTSSSDYAMSLGVQGVN